MIQRKKGRHLELIWVKWILDDDTEEGRQIFRVDMSEVDFGWWYKGRKTDILGWYEWSGFWMMIQRKHGTHLELIWVKCIMDDDTEEERQTFRGDMSEVDYGWWWREGKTDIQSLYEWSGLWMMMMQRREDRHLELIWAKWIMDDETEEGRQTFRVDMSESFWTENILCREKDIFWGNFVCEKPELWFPNRNRKFVMPRILWKVFIVISES